MPIKIAIIGNINSGKTSLIRNYIGSTSNINNNYIGDHEFLYSKEFDQNSHTRNIIFGRYSYLCDNAQYQTDAFVYTIDLNELVSSEAPDNLLDAVVKKCSGKFVNSDLPRYLVFTKTDKVRNKISDDVRIKLERLALSYGMKGVFFTDATRVDDPTIKCLFDHIIEHSHSPNLLSRILGAILNALLAPILYFIAYNPLYNFVYRWDCIFEGKISFHQDGDSRGDARQSRRKSIILNIIDTIYSLLIHLLKPLLIPFYYLLPNIEITFKNGWKRGFVTGICSPLEVLSNWDNRRITASIVSTIMICLVTVAVLLTLGIAPPFLIATGVTAAVASNAASVALFFGLSGLNLGALAAGVGVTTLGVSCLLYLVINGSYQLIKNLTSSEYQEAQQLSSNHKTNSSYDKILPELSDTKIEKQTYSPGMLQYENNEMKPGYVLFKPERGFFSRLFSECNTIEEEKISHSTVQFTYE